MPPQKCSPHVGTTRITRKNRKSLKKLRPAFNLSPGATNESAHNGSDASLEMNHQSVIMNNNSEPLEINMVDDFISLKVLNEDNEQVLFNIKKFAALGKLMDAWCQAMDISKTAVNFKFDGKVIDEKDTASSLQLINDDIIQVFYKRISMREIEKDLQTVFLDETPNAAPQQISDCTDRTASPEQMDLTGSNSDKVGKISQKIPDYINVNILGPDNTIIRFKIDTSSPLLVLKKAYCLRVGLQIATIRFAIDGKIINEADTPLLLQMNEEDILEVFLQ